MVLLLANKSFIYWWKIKSFVCDNSIAYIGSMNRGIQESSFTNIFYTLSSTNHIICVNISRKYVAGSSFCYIYQVINQFCEFLTEKMKMIFQNTAGSLSAFYLLTRKEHNSCKWRHHFLSLPFPFVLSRLLISLHRPRGRHRLDVGKSPHYSDLWNIWDRIYLFPPLKKEVSKFYQQHHSQIITQMNEHSTRWWTYE